MHTKTLVVADESGTAGLADGSHRRARRVAWEQGSVNGSGNGQRALASRISSTRFLARGLRFLPWRAFVELCLGAARELAAHIVVGLGDQFTQFGVTHGVNALKRYPVIAAHIRRLAEALALEQFGEALGRALQRQVRMGGVQPGAGKDLAGDAEQQIIAPLDLLGGAGKRQAVLAK